MDKYLGKYNPPKLSEEEVKNLNRTITADEIKAVIKKLLTHKALDLTVSQENSTEHLRES